MIIKFLKNSSSSLVDYKKYLNLPKNKREIIFYAEKESDFVFLCDIYLHAHCSSWNEEETKI